MTTVMSSNLNGFFFFGSIIVVCCIIAAYDAFSTWYHQHRMNVPDEFEEAYDPYADVKPSWNNIDRVRTILFQDVASMHTWLCTNVPSEHRKVQLYVQAIVAKEQTGIYRFTVELSDEERLRVL